MSFKNIFPAGIAEYTAEQHFQRHYTPGHMIYLILLLAAALGMGSLFFIRVDISVSSHGMFTAATKKNTLKAPVSGRIDQVLIRENQSVKAGDLLLTLRADVLEEEMAYLASRRKELSRRISDLRQLSDLQLNSLQQLNGLQRFSGLQQPGAAGDAPLPPETISLGTSLYRQQYTLFRQQQAEAELTLSNARIKYERQKALHDQEVISDAEFDQFRYELKNAETRLALLGRTRQSYYYTRAYEILLTVQLRPLDAAEAKDITGGAGAGCRTDGPGAVGNIWIMLS